MLLEHERNYGLGVDALTVAILAQAILAQAIWLKPSQDIRKSPFFHNTERQPHSLPDYAISVLVL